MTTATPSWPGEIFDALRAWEVRQVVYVPDAGHKELIERCIAEDSMETVPLTTEEEGVALLAGAWLGGQRGVLLMQSSGVGNCINMLSLIRTCRFPLLTLITMRGEAGEFNPWQEPMGRITAPVLDLAGCEVVSLESAARAGETVTQAARTAYEGPAAVAVLIAQRMIGIKSFED